MANTLGRTSQRVLDAVLVASVAVIVAYTGWQIATLTRVLHRTSDAASTSRYRTGERLPPLEAMASDVPNTLAVVLSSGCRFCAMSIPFYRDLIQTYGRASTQDRQRVRVIAMCQESTASCRAYLDRERLAFDEVVSATEMRLKLVATPTLLLVDRSREIRNVWIGYQDHAGQAAISAFLRSSLGFAPP